MQQSLALERERLRNLEVSDELLRALSTVLDIRQVFPRVSQIAATVLPHDLLTFTFHDQYGNVLLQAASDESTTLPMRLRLADSGPPGDGFYIVSDIESHQCPVIEPRGFSDRIRAAGFRSMLAIRLAARDQLLGLQFWSKRTGAFEPRQVPIARRIADHVALAVSHEQRRLPMRTGHLRAARPRPRSSSAAVPIPCA